MSSHEAMTQAWRSEVENNPMGDMYLFFFDAVTPGRYVLTVSGFGWSKTVREVIAEKKNPETPNMLGLPLRSGCPERAQTRKPCPPL
jgi:hypothetical protein